MSTLLMTAAISVLASHRGLPVSFAMVVANSSSALRTTLAKRRSASMRKATECAAQPAQAARAAATSAAASPTLPDQSFSPVAGSYETSSLTTGAGFTTSASASRLRCIRPHRLPHPAYGCNLVGERLPVVTLGDGRPDGLDFIDVHRTRRRIRPIWVRLRRRATLERPGQRAERFGRIFVRPGIAATAPVEENAVDSHFAGRQRVDQCARDLPIAGDAKPPQ